MYNSYESADAMAIGGVLVVTMIVVWLIAIITIAITFVSLWKIFKKLGQPGIFALIPYFNMYILFETIYGNGWKFLCLLIPFYNIYISFKLYIDIAKKLGKSTIFGICIVLFPLIFLPILAFGRSQCIDNNSDPIEVSAEDRQREKDEALARLRQKHED